MSTPVHISPLRRWVIIYLYGLSSPYWSRSDIAEEAGYSTWAVNKVINEWLGLTDNRMIEMDELLINIKRR